MQKAISDHADIWYQLFNKQEKAPVSLNVIHREKRRRTMKNDHEAGKPVNDPHASAMLINLLLDTLKYLYDEQKRHDMILRNMPYGLLTPDVSRALQENVEAAKAHVTRIEGVIVEMTHTENML